MNRYITHVMRLSRPRFWLYLAGPALLGLVYGAGSVGSVFTLSHMLVVLYFLVPANVLLYGVNDIFDRRIDRKNPKKEEKEVRFDEAPRVTMAATALAGLLSAMLLLHLSGVALLGFAGFVVLAVGYSAPPTRFKARPVLDSVSNGLYILPGVATYGMLTGSLPPLPVLAAGWLWTMAMHTFSAIPDIGPDREAGVRTTATVLGRGRSLVYCTTAWLLSAVAAGAVSWGFGLLMAVYPMLSLSYLVYDREAAAVYWWYPYINGLVGMVMTVAGILRIA